MYYKINIDRKKFEVIIFHAQGTKKSVIKNKIDYSNWEGELNTIQERVDGQRQIWIKDPQGYWIEINSTNQQ